MTHDELLKIVINEVENAELRYLKQGLPFTKALRAVIELHKPDGQSKPFPDWANCCDKAYPCQTIQAIEKELK